MNPETLAKLWKKFDLKKFWQKVIAGQQEDMDAYREARAKSRGGLV